MLNGSHQQIQEIEGLGLGGRAWSDAYGDGQVQRPGEQERSSRRAETNVHPGRIGRRPFVALGPQRGRERGMCDSGGCHERCLIRRERVYSIYFDWLLIVGIPTARARGHHDGQVL